MQRMFPRHLMTLLIALTTLATIGCQPGFHQLRMEGRNALRDQHHAIARDCFERAHDLWPEHARNLCDLGNLSMHYAKKRAEQGNQAATLRELDQAVWYYARAIESHPGLQAALVGKNHALEQKGRFDDALDEAHWAMTFVGPSSREQIFMARELEERGDLDGALLRYRQGVAIEPDNAHAHAALGDFLLRQQKTEQAIEHFKRAYTLNPLEPGVADVLTDNGIALPRTTPEAPSK